MLLEFWPLKTSFPSPCTLDLDEVVPETPTLHLRFPEKTKMKDYKSIKCLNSKLNLRRLEGKCKWEQPTCVRLFLCPFCWYCYHVYKTLNQNILDCHTRIYEGLTVWISDLLNKSEQRKWMMSGIKTSVSGFCFSLQLTWILHLYFTTMCVWILAHRQLQVTDSYFVGYFRL